MSDRFYFQMLNREGTAPGYKGKARKKRMAWTDEKKAEVISMYEERDPTPENSVEIVAEIAEELEESPNAVRTILSKAGVYVKKGSAAKAKAGGTGGTRVSKKAAQEGLAKAIADTGHAVDDEIISRLTGKAAAYLTEVINAASS